MQASTRQLAAVLLIVAGLTGCRRQPADSSTPQFAKAADRIEWIDDAITSGAPSKVTDAHFRDLEVNYKGGHMGPGHTMRWFWARIEIDPADAPKWSARTKEIPTPRHWSATTAPILEPAPYGMPPHEFAGSTWYDPAPLFPKSAHSGYQAGAMAINDSGTEVYVWQHWR